MSGTILTVSLSPLSSFMIWMLDILARKSIASQKLVWWLLKSKGPAATRQRDTLSWHPCHIKESFRFLWKKLIYFLKKSKYALWSFYWFLKILLWLLLILKCISWFSITFLYLLLWSIVPMQQHLPWRSVFFILCHIFNRPKAMMNVYI